MKCYFLNLLSCRSLSRYFSNPTTWANHCIILGFSDEIISKVNRTKQTLVLWTLWARSWFLLLRSDSAIVRPLDSVPFQVPRFICFAWLLGFFSSSLFFGLLSVVGSYNLFCKFRICLILYLVKLGMALRQYFPCCEVLCCVWHSMIGEKLHKERPFRLRVPVEIIKSL